MPDEVLFVNTESLFAKVEELRRSFRGVEPAESLTPVPLSNTSASDSLTTTVGLAASLLGSIGPQLELIARSMSLGALRVIAADQIEGED